MTLRHVMPLSFIFSALSAAGVQPAPLTTDYAGRQVDVAVAATGRVREETVARYMASNAAINSMPSHRFCTRMFSLKLC